VWISRPGECRREREEGGDMNKRPSLWARSIGLFLAGVTFCALRPPGPTGALGQSHEIALPALNPALSPLADENRFLLFDRLIMAFGRDYAAYYLRTEGRPLNDGMTVYYLQRELQACLDMWRATGYLPYLDRATDLTLRAVKEAILNPRPLLWHDIPRGERPCFYLDSVRAETGGHSQLCDFQGSSGFLMVARVMQELNQPGWTDIADFVERDVVEKWLFYRPSITEEHLRGPQSGRYLLAVLNSGRDVREHFACICLDLHALGYRRYPYRDWASLLIDLYLTPRYDPNQLPPRLEEVADHLPRDWGLSAHTEDGYTWLAVPSYDPNGPTDALDTSHANRTAWLAAKAAAEGLISKSIILGLANTFRFRIWAPEKGPFYFNNYVDGYDGDLGGLTAGRGGNIWFGWHRLAAFDRELEDLFLGLAYDLTNGGPNLPQGAQNKTMADAPLCLQAWGARLLSAQGQPGRFP
jgi:hypothetical protein